MTWAFVFISMRRAHHPRVNPPRLAADPDDEEVHGEVDEGRGLVDGEEGVERRVDGVEDVREVKRQELAVADPVRDGQDVRRRAQQPVPHGRLLVPLHRQLPARPCPLAAAAAATLEARRPDRDRHGPRERRPPRAGNYCFGVAG